jgi:plasmid stabilization system protein ParE
MQFDVIFSETANDTFEAIEHQLLERFGEREVNEFRKRTYQVVEIISTFPFTFKAVGKEKNLRKALIHRNCSMFYDVGDRYIEVLFFWDNRQDQIL